MKTGNLNGQFSWDTAGAIDDLKTWWAEGYSCSRIAENIHKKYGGYPTRNAVIGKVTRLGLPTHKNLSPRHVKALPRNPRAAAKAKIDGKPPRTTPFRLGPDDVSEEIISSLDPRDVPLEQRKQLLDLKPENCRFPYGDVGDDDFFFCGAPVISGRCYCAFHFRVAHSPAKRKTISRAEFERNRLLGLRAKERHRVNREASA